MRVIITVMQRNWWGKTTIKEFELGKLDNNASFLATGDNKVTVAVQMKRVGRPRK